MNSLQANALGQLLLKMQIKVCFSLIVKSKVIFKGFWMIKSKNFGELKTHVSTLLTMIMIFFYPY
jgi:hypothetical protein